MKVKKRTKRLFDDLNALRGNLNFYGKFGGMI